MSSISVSCCHLNPTLFLWEKSFRPDALLHVMRPPIQAIKKSCSWMSPLGDINQTVHERTYRIYPPTCIIRQEIETIPPWLMCPSGFGWHFPSALKIQTQIRLLIKSIMWINWTKKTHRADSDPDPLLLPFWGIRAAESRAAAPSSITLSCFALWAQQKAAGRPRAQRRLWRGTWR